jgi:antirestriction protein ArdC
MSETNKTNVMKEKMDQYINKLALELEGGHTELFKEYLKVVSKFHKYSFGNQMLISMQNPAASHVAGFKTWQSLGRQVRKGSKAIYILAPCKSKKTVTTGGKDEEKPFIWFRSVPVFDVSSTDGEALPEWYHSLGDDTLNIFNRLKAAMIERGIPVTECSIPGGALGRAYADRIEIEESLDPMNKALTLIHEAAHVLLKHQGENKNLSREFKEAQAEAATFCVSQHFGVDSPFTKDYLISWKATDGVLRENLTAITKVSQEIIDILICEEVAESKVSVSEELEQIAA